MSPTLGRSEIFSKHHLLSSGAVFGDPAHSDTGAAVPLSEIYSLDGLLALPMVRLPLL